MTNPQEGLDLADPLERPEGPELFFGLVGPLGANLDLICDALVDRV